MGEWYGIMWIASCNGNSPPLSLANKNGYFDAELVPMEVKGKKGPEMMTVDEHPRETTLEKLGTLPPVFKENGTVTAGSASV